jgi:nicotinamide mononucleotide transporter
MLRDILDWISGNWPELTGSVLGLISVFFQYRQNSLLWPLSIVVAVLYTYVFVRSGLYAYSLLQLYYIIISIYGWYIWIRKTDKQESLKITKTSLTSYVILLIAFIVLYAGLFFTLRYFTDSDVEYADSFLTALSFVATWMLARKKLENWIIWFIADIVSVGLYLHKELYATAIFYSVLTIVAIFGYFEWKKQMQKSLRLQ